MLPEGSLRKRVNSRHGLKQKRNSLRSSVKIKFQGRKSKDDSRNVLDLEIPQKSVAVSIAEHLSILQKSNAQSRSVLSK